MQESFKIPTATFLTLTGSIVTFNSQYAGLPLKSHTIALTATQSGSGTPSPSNPRPISGYSAIHIGNISDNTNISYFKGVLNGTYGFIDLGDLEWSYDTTFLAIITNSRVDGQSLCIKYARIAGTWSLNDKSYRIGTNAIRIRDDSYTDAATFKASLDGVYLIYELATPITPSFTNAEFEALCEAFGMNGQSFIIQIGSTVYGGEYDARTGVLTATKASVILDSSNVPTSEAYVQYNSATDVYSWTYNNILVGVTNQASVICDKLSLSADAYNRTSGGKFYCTGGLGERIYVSMEGSVVGSKAGMIQWLRDNTPLFVYELGTPTTIQLPPCPIDTLEGVNNIWADTGETTLQYIELE